MTLPEQDTDLLHNQTLVLDGSSQPYSFQVETYTEYTDSEGAMYTLHDGHEATGPTQIKVENGQLYVKAFGATEWSAVGEPLGTEETTTGTAQAGGDPYVHPLRGPPVKLPNVECTYRMYQDDDVIINADVRAATPEARAQIERAARQSAAAALGVDAVSAGAFFFRRVLVAHRASGETLTLDLETRTWSGSTPNLRLGSPVLVESDKAEHAYDMGAASAVHVPIEWGNGRLALAVHFVRNPQVRNGLGLSGTFPAGSTGLMVRNFRPKLWQLASLSDIRERSPTSRRLYSNRGTAAHREVSILVSA